MTADATDLSGLVAVVTGAAAGLGRAEAIGLARAGATVVVNDIAGALDKSDVIDEIVATVSKAVAVAGDIAERSTADELVATADGLGGLSIVVNNAGITRDRMLFNMTDEDWDAVMAVHLRGHFLLTRNAATYWRAKAKEGDGTVYGRIINTSSEAGLAGPVGQANYGAAKAGITALTLSAGALRGAGECHRPPRPHGDDRRRLRGIARVGGGPGRPAVARTRRESGPVPRLSRVGRGERTAVHRLWSDGDPRCGADGRAAVQCGIRSV
jgi:NADP-dependent 3-hydroxy acid dehydrogenase YdfG